MSPPYVFPVNCDIYNFSVDKNDISVNKLSFYWKFIPYLKMGSSPEVFLEKPFK